MIRLLSLFSGIGAFEKALDRIGAKYELVNYCEIDKYASMAYAAVHGVSEELNLRDVQTIDCDKLKDSGVNLVTWGFPCQDISVAGLMRGFEHNGQKTRSGLFYDALKVIRELQPEIAIAENVKALTGKKFKAEFAAVRGGLADAGYNNYYAVLNASDYGIPQHRERVFIVSIRKDIDRDEFAFPQKEPLRLRVKDLLEYEVEEKYYIDTDRARELIRKLAEEGKLPGNEPAVAAMRGRDPENPSNRHSGVHTEQKIEVNTFGTSNTITTVQKDNHIIEPNIKTVGNLDGHETGRVLDTDGITQSLKGTNHKNPVKIALKQVGETGPHQTDRVYDAEGRGRTLKATEPIHPMKILDVMNRKSSSYEKSVRQIGQLLPETKFKNSQRGRVYDSAGCCPTINTMQGGSLEPKIIDVMNREKDGTCRTLLSSYYKTSPANLESNLSRSSSGAVEKIDTGCKAVGDLKVGGERGIVYDAEKSMCTLSATQYKDPHKVLNEYRIRKLTPKECWRLMGFDDDDFEKARAAGISNTQLYKQAGNSIVVQVLERIFERLIETQGIGDKMNEDMTVWEVFGKAQCPVEIWGWDVETGCSFMMRRFTQKEVGLGDFRDDPVFQTYAEQYIVKLTVKGNRLQVWISEL